MGTRSEMSSRPSSASARRDVLAAEVVFVEASVVILRRSALEARRVWEGSSWLVAVAVTVVMGAILEGNAMLGGFLCECAVQLEVLL